MEYKNIHRLVLKDIDDKNAGRYRTENVMIKGSVHVPPDYLKVPELMEKLIRKLSLMEFISSNYKSSITSWRIS